MSDSAKGAATFFQGGVAVLVQAGMDQPRRHAAHIAIMHDDLVEKKRWISNASFLHALSHCMILPGPEAQQLAIYIGWKLHGKWGGVVAGTLFVLPSMFVLLALSVIYVRLGNLLWIAAIFEGLKPAVIALVVVALQRVARSALRGPVQSAVAGATFAAMFFFDVSLLLVMLGAVVLGTALGTLRPGLLPVPRKAGGEENDEASYYISRNSVTPEPAPLLKPPAKLTAIVLLLWLLPVPAFYFFVEDFHFWKNLVLFFTKTAFVTIGGSYTVIPSVAQVTVSTLHWLTRLQMMDGFALAETTPGASHHCGGFCWIHGRVQPLPRLAMDGCAGPAGNNVLHVSTVFSLRICRRSTGGANTGQADDSGCLGINHCCRSRRDSQPDTLSGEGCHLSLRDSGTQTARCNLARLGDTFIWATPEIQTQCHSPDPAERCGRFDPLFARSMTELWMLPVGRQSES
jgi:putative chromate ion transporter